jgi:hypothetical protein
MEMSDQQHSFTTLSDLNLSFPRFIRLLSLNRDNLYISLSVWLFDQVIENFRAFAWPVRGWRNIVTENSSAVWSIKVKISRSVPMFLTNESVTSHGLQFGYRLRVPFLHSVVWSKRKETISRVGFDSLAAIQTTHAIVLTVIHFRGRLYSSVVAVNEEYPLITMASIFSTSRQYITWYCCSSLWHFLIIKRLNI